MDNTCYFQGDTIWFSVYTRQTGSGEPSRISRVLYAELLNHDGYLVERKLIEMKDGRGNGFFALNHPIQYSGYYELRAYTRWQLNWGLFEHKHGVSSQEWFVNKELEELFYRDYEKLYSRVFPVYDKPEEEGIYTRDMTMRPMRRYFRKDMDAAERKYVLTLFPEGGNFVADIPNRVAFEATWNDGEWLDGTLYFSGDSAISIHRGRGVFTITPMKDIERDVRFVTSDGNTIKAKMPAALMSGVALSVNRMGTCWDLQVRMTKDMFPDSMALTIMREGEILFFRPLSKREETILVNENDLGAGVHQATVFDTQGRVFADRLFFVRKSDTEKPNVRVSGIRDEYQPYEKMDMEISSLSETTRQKGFLSVSVRDGYQDDYLHDDATIMQEMLLASEIRGFVPDPGWYFEADDSLHRTGLDLLMMTQGWRRFEWRNMAVKGEWRPIQPAEQSPIITGRVYKYDLLSDRSYDDTDYESVYEEKNGGERNKRVTRQKQEVRVHVELVHSESREIIAGEVETRNGYFRIQLPNYYGTSDFIIAAADTTKWNSNKKRGKDEYVGEKRLRKVGKAHILSPENLDGYIDQCLDFYIPVSFPYPRFVLPYTYHQRHPNKNKERVFSMKGYVKDGVTIMPEIQVNRHRMNGLRKVNQSSPAFLIPPLTALNIHIDSGMLYGSLIRALMSDYGLEYPYVSDVNTRDKSFMKIRETNRKMDKIYSQRSLDYAERHFAGLPELSQIPEDSLFFPKNIQIKDRTPDNLGLFLYPVSNVKMFAIYTDYSPRLEGSKRYLGSDLPETDVAFLRNAKEEGDFCYPYRRYILPGFSYPAEFYSPDYSRQTPPDSVKDYRRTLYWNPNLMLDENGKATVTLSNCSRTTRPVVTTAGQAADGTLLWNE